MTLSRGGVTDDDGLEGSPWYVRFLVRVGIPTAFASLLLWYLMTDITGTLAHIVTTQDEEMKLQSQVIANQQRIIELLTANASEQRANWVTLSALCYNAADTADDRARCAQGHR